MRLLRLLLPFLALAVLPNLVGCRSATPDDATALVLRTYAVPKGSARSIVAVLDATFWVGEQQKRYGRVAVTPDGRVAVLAPANVQTGIETLVDEVAKHPPTFDGMIELHYFVVVGKPGSSDQPFPPGMSEIQPAFDEIVRSQGPQTFTVAQHAHLATAAGDFGRVEADKLKVTQKAAQTAEGVDALVTVEMAGGDKIESRVLLAPDRIVVLGATGHRSDPPDGSTLYYVVRVAPRGPQK
jgi:hypothetical protein